MKKKKTKKRRCTYNYIYHFKVLNAPGVKFITKSNMLNYSSNSQYRKNCHIKYKKVRKSVSSENSLLWKYDKT